MKFPPLGHSASVVLLGSFNPSIFHPSWLALNGIVDKEQADDAEIGIVHQEIAEFKVGDFLVKVEPERFQISSKQEPFVSLLDTVTGIFGELLVHTPIRQLGINYGLHFALNSAKQRHALGRTLAPLEPWGEWGASLETGDLGSTGGMRMLALEQTVAPRRERGYRRVHLEPSVRDDLVDPTVGIYMMVNDHFEAPTIEAGSNAAACMEWLVNNFDVSIEESKKIVSDVMEFAGKL